jgi:peptidoglycan/xylan/chitin deacetylase (PgdA/CDA1 family)
VRVFEYSMIAKSTKLLFKRAAADMLGNTFVFACTDWLQKSLHFPFVRVVSYHDTPRCHASKLRMHLQWYAENFVNCDQASLDRFLLDGSWPHDKPGLVISFDDGLSSNAAVAAPLLEEFGFTGWFMVPAVAPNTDIGSDREFADEVLIPFLDEDPGARLFMSWDDMRLLVKNGHEICCHSLNHKRLGACLSPSELIEEIQHSKADLERGLGNSIQSFAWVGGESHSFSRAAFDEMVKAGYRRVFSTNCYPVLPRQTQLCLERNHVDSAFNLNELRLSVGGLYDLFYKRKRRRTNRVIGLERGSNDRHESE